jgi:hypothetical protein
MLSSIARSDAAIIREAFRLKVVFITIRFSLIGIIKGDVEIEHIGQVKTAYAPELIIIFRPIDVIFLPFLPKTSTVSGYNG